jgi:hypothetical protein
MKNFFLGFLAGIGALTGIAYATKKYDLADRLNTVADKITDSI